ncbi:hypothetical protein M422DRAFT_260684 [Sphaerobolus stellatus SS14]|uniref:Uncharacterized protein n=1 Tax=Sphaerobolus stellatus (strain SS14) TaxID=990650 RepID=A0A0C9UQ14_SPHS4|nr:hypothetical protein M422DRAFT_260684 [Sphaerobolus stellatus SS14]
MRDYPINYTIYADAGLSLIDIENRKSDFEEWALRLKWLLIRLASHPAPSFSLSSSFWHRSAHSP